MSTEFLLAVTLVLMAALGAIAWNRGAIVAAMLLPASELLGFVDPMRLAIKGSFDIHALIMLIVALMTVVGLGRIGELRHARFFKPFLVLMAFWLLGCIMPVVRGESTAFQALEASKEFMMLLAYPATFLFMQGERESRLAWLLLIGLGAYYCALEIVVQFAGLTLLGKLTYFYRPDDFGLWKLYVQFWSVILYLFLYHFFTYLTEGRLRLGLLLLASLGLILTFYRSYLLATIVATPAVLLLARLPLTRMMKAGASALVGLVAVIGATAVLATGQGADVERIGDALVFSGVAEISSGSGGSLDGRREYGNELYELADERPWLGYGFINQESKFAQRLGLAGFSASVLGFVDKGSADVLVKFGYIGGAIVYLAFAWIALRAIGITRQIPAGPLSSKALTVAAVILISFIVQIVHAPLTYSFALLPLALAMGIVDREYLLLRQRGEAHG